MSPSIKIRKMSCDISRKLDFCSDSFDAVAALRSNNVIMPYPKSKTYNNLAEYYSHTFERKKNEKDSNRSSLIPAKNQQVLKRNYAWYFATLGLDLSENSNKTRFHKVSRKKRINCSKYGINKTLFKEVSSEMFEPIRSEKIVVKRSNGSLKQYILRNGEIKIAHKRKFNEVFNSNEISASEDGSLNPDNLQVVKSNTQSARVSTSLKSCTELTKHVPLNKNLGDVADYQKDKIYTLYSLRQKIKTLQQLHSDWKGIKNPLNEKSSDKLEVGEKRAKIASIAQSDTSDVCKLNKSSIEAKQQDSESSASLLKINIDSASSKCDREHYLETKRKSDIIKEKILGSTISHYDVLDKTIRNTSCSVELNGEIYINKENEDIGISSKERNILTSPDAVNTCPSSSIKNKNDSPESTFTYVNTGRVTSLENESSKVVFSLKDIITCDENNICEIDQITKKSEELNQSASLTVSESNVLSTGYSTLVIRENNDKEKALLELARKARDKVRAEKEKKSAKEASKVNQNSEIVHKSSEPNCFHTSDIISLKTAAILKSKVHFNKRNKINFDSQLKAFPKCPPNSDAVEASTNYNLNVMNNDNAAIMPVLPEVRENNSCKILGAEKLLCKTNLFKENNAIIKDTKVINLKMNYKCGTIYQPSNADMQIEDFGKIDDWDSNINMEKKDLVKQSTCESDLPVLVSINLKLINIASMKLKNAAANSVLKERNVIEFSNKKQPLKIPNGNPLKGYKIPKKKKCYENNENIK